MPYEFYKIFHFIGLITGICAVSALIYRTWAEGTSPVKGKRPIMIAHGIAVVLMLISGFGLLARLGIIGSWPFWVWIKIAGLAFLILAPTLVLRVPATRKHMWWIFPVVLFFVAYSVVYKLGV